MNNQAKFTFPIWGWIYVFFSVVFAMNAFMVYMAISTWNGLSTDGAYEKGLRHNQAIADAKSHSNWNANIIWQNDTRSLNVNTQEGVTVTATLFRPTTQGYDQKIVLKEMTSGHYQASIPATLLKGQWDVRVFIKKDEGSAQFRQRIMVQ